MCAAAAVGLWACNTNEIDVPYPDQPDQEQQGSDWQQVGLPDGQSYIHATGTPASNLRVISRDDLKYLAAPIEGFTDITFKAGTPEGVLPKVGEIICVAPDAEMAPAGYMCRIDEVSNQGGAVTCSGSAATLDEAFTNHDVDMYLSPEGLAEACGGSVYELVADNGSRFDDDDTQPGDTEPVIGVDLRGWKLGGKVDFKAKTEIEGHEARGIEVTGTAKFDSDKYFEGNKEMAGAGWKVNADINVNAGLFYAMAFQSREDTGLPYSKLDLWSQFKMGAHASLTGEWNQAHDAAQGRKYAAPIFNIPPKMFVVPVTIAPGVTIPVRFTVKSRTEVGIFGDVKWDFGFDYKCTAHTGFTVSDSQVEMMTPKIVQPQGSPFQVENKFSFNAGLFLQFPTTVTFPVINEKVSGIVLRYTPRLELTTSGEVDFTNKDESLYSVNPDISLDLAGDIGAKWYLRTPVKKWQICTNPISLELPTVKLLTCPLLPQALPQTQRKDGASTGTVRWSVAKPPLYGAFLGVLSHEPKMIVTDQDGKIFATLNGGVVEELKNAFVYQATVSGMDPDRDYYAVPVIDIFQLTMRGTPVKMGDYALPSQLLTGISESVLGQVLTLSYTPEGKLKRLYCRMDEDGATEVLYSYPSKPQAEGYLLPEQIEVYYWESDASGEPLRRDEVIRVSSIKYDNTGRITSAHFYDQELPTDPEPESGTVTFRYDPSHGHLTEIRGGGGQGNIAWKIGENADGRTYELSGITVRDDEGTGSSMNWAYDKEPTSNVHGQWTYTMWTNDLLMPFAHAGLIGEGPNVLPSQATIMSEGEVTKCTMSFKLNSTGYVGCEYLTAYIEGYGNYTFGLNYSYAGGRSLLAAPSRTGDKNVRIPFLPGKGKSRLFGKRSH